MMPSITGDKARWVVSVGTATAATLGLLWLFQFPPSMVPLRIGESSAPQAAGVQLAKTAAADALLKEEAEIRDLRPLFLPTEFNATIPEPRREPGRTFLDNEVKEFGFADGDLAVGKNLPPVATINGKSAELATPVDFIAADASGGPLVGFGREPARVTPFGARVGFIEVYASATGEKVLADVLPVDAGPVGGATWEPMELLAAVDPAGLTAPLVVTTSSRHEEVDAHFRDFLARKYRVGERLRPGFYRITVAP